MKFGCCLAGGSFVPQVEGQKSERGAMFELKKGLQTLIDNDYDFAELTVGALANLSEEDFGKAKEIISDSGISVPVLNSFVPTYMKLTGPEVNDEKIINYIQMVMKRANEIGVKIIIFGSGSARSCPEGFDRFRAMEQIKTFLKNCNQYSKRYDLIVAIEPLNKKESNLIHTVKEAIHLAQEMNLSQIKVMADSYHMLVEDEPISVLKDAVDRGLLAHVHIADRQRIFPGTVVDNDKYFRTFFQTLHQCEYQGAVSAECSVDDFVEASRKSLKYVKSLWREIVC